MPSQLSTLLRSILLCCLVSISGQTQAAAIRATQDSATQEKQTEEQFIAEIRQNFQQDNFAALDAAADQARESKERFPGGDWKLYVFYRTLTWPNSATLASDQQWKAHLNRLEQWKDKSTKSQTARIALANAWVEYANLAYSSREDWIDLAEDWTGFGKRKGGKEFSERLRKAEKALGFDTKSFFAGIAKGLKREATVKPDPKLPSSCPHWYFVVMALQRGRPSDEWRKYDAAFANGIAMEPGYYYLYQTRAFDLLPQNYGVKGEWENFAEDSAKRLGGNEGDIVYYMIVSYVMPRYVSRDGHGDFFRDNPTIWGQKIWDGYKQIEEGYGTSKYRQNEMALIASKAQQYAVAKILFDRIGEDWDERVWQKKAVYDGYRNMARAKASTTATTLIKDLSVLKATLSSSLAAYQKSQDVVIQAVVEYPASESDSDSGLEVGMAAFALVIQDSNKRGQETVLLPQADGSQPVKLIKAGGVIRLTYRINFPLPAGTYQAKMKSLTSNELRVRIGGTTRR